MRFNDLRRGRTPIFFAGFLSLGLCAAVALSTAPAVAAHQVGPVMATPRIAPDEEALRAAAQRVLDAGATGVIVRVDDGHHVVRFALGAARLEPSQALSPGDEVRIASNTKMFVSTIVLQLAAEHRLRLDDSVERWLPGLVPNGRRITLRMLLNHTSGLYDYFEDDTFASLAFADLQRVDHVFSPRELVGYATAHPPVFAPGNGWAYSNTNYILLGLILEKATHEPVGELIDRRVVRPLGLHHTYLQTTAAFRGRHAHGYLTPQDSGAGYLDLSGRNDASLAWAAGAMVSTADELAVFSKALLSGRLLPTAQLREMTTLVPQSKDRELPGTSYGLGLMSMRNRCGQGWGHLGSIPGYRSRTFTDVTGTRGVQFLTPTESTDEIAAAANDFMDEAFCAMFDKPAQAGLGSGREEASP